jgi:RecB family exonuclease
MRIPIPPNPETLTHLSPSQYQAGRMCKARLAWATRGRRDELPEHPKALLGTSFHAVVEAAALGHFPDESEDLIGMAAREMFDHVTGSAYGRAHDLLRVKYRSADALPYYYLFRERAAVAAISVADRREQPSGQTVRACGTAPPRRLIETTLTSSDGLLIARPDYVDLQAQEIVDYKTGATLDDAAAMSAAEVRQLNLYVHLALENDLAVSRGVIVRPDGRRVVAEVTKAEANAEGQRARAVLEQFNQTAVGRTFDAIAQPSTEACQFCPCIPFCGSFWRDATPAWLEDCGMHVEGCVTAITESSVQDVQLLTFDLEVSRGTLDATRAFVEQVPESWTTVGGCARPGIGEILRAVHGRATSAGPIPVIRVDRTLTSLWTGPQGDAPATVALDTR